MDYSELAERISRLRKERGLSQKELGELLGVSNKAVSKWENGESLPKTSTMLKLAELLGIDGNELIGLESQQKQAPPAQSSAEVEALKSENASLHYQLGQMNKRRRRTLLTVVGICVTAVVLTAVLLLSFSTSTSRFNRHLARPGQDGTSIVFGAVTFVPCDETEAYLIQYQSVFGSFDSVKYADYYDGEAEQRVAIHCTQRPLAVMLKTGGDTYYYIKEDARIRISPERFSGVVLVSSSVSRNSEFDPDRRNAYSASQARGRELINAFCTFYGDRGEAADKKLTEQYLGSYGRILRLFASVSEDAPDCAMELGEFFCDEAGNTYFYSYIDAAAYPVGKELSELVYDR